MRVRGVCGRVWVSGMGGYSMSLNQTQEETKKSSGKEKEGLYGRAPASCKLKTFKCPMMQRRRNPDPQVPGGEPMVAHAHTTYQRPVFHTLTQCLLCFSGNHLLS